MRCKLSPSSPPAWKFVRKAGSVLGSNARIGSDQCHPGTCVSQGLFSPDILAGPVSLRLMLLPQQAPCPPFWEVFRAEKHPPSNKPPQWAGRESLCGVCGAKGRSEGWETSCWSSFDSAFSLRVARGLCPWPMSSPLL